MSFSRRSCIAALVGLALLSAATVVRAENCTTTVSTSTANESMSRDAWVTVATCVAMLVILMLGWVGCAPALIVATVFLYLNGIISIKELLAGFSNASVVTIALLFICVDPIADLPLVKKFVGLCLTVAPAAPGDKSPSVRGPIAKIILMCLATSSFLNNAPQVAMLTTMIKNFCRSKGLYPSQFLMPMNFATLCGNYAIIGTSTNLIVDGLMRKYGLGAMPFFELTKINGPFTVVTLLYLVFMPQWLLPLKGTGLARAKTTSRSALVLLVARVLEGSSIIGARLSDVLARVADQSVEVLQIHRTTSDCTSQTLFPLTGEEIIEAGDLLTVKADREAAVGLASPLGLQWHTAELVAPANGVSDHEGDNDLKPFNLSFTDAPRSFAGAPAAGGAPAGQSLSRATHEPFRSATPNNSFGARGMRQRRALNTGSSRAVDRDSREELTVITPAAADDNSDHLNAGSAARHRHVAVAAEHTQFFEVVVSQRCPHVGCVLGTGQFQTRYMCSVVSLRRFEHDDVTAGEGLADHVLIAGDTLLLLSRSDFNEKWHESRDFLVINPINGEGAEDEELPPLHIQLPMMCPIGTPVENAEGGGGYRQLTMPAWYRYLMIPIFAAMISCAIAEFELAACALLAVITVVTLRIITAEQAYDLIEIEVIVMVAFSFGLGSAMENSGFASYLGQQVKKVNISGIGLLYLISGMTTLMTNVITNKACVQVLVPLIVAVYHAQGQCALPAVMMCCSLASMALSTPHGFATNLMIMGPGGYTPADFIKFGLPLNLLAAGIIPLITVAVYSMPL